MRIAQKELHRKILLQRARSSTTSFNRRQRIALHAPRHTSLPLSVGSDHAENTKPMTKCHQIYRIVYARLRRATSPTGKHSCWKNWCQLAPVSTPWRARITGGYALRCHFPRDLPNQLLRFNDNQDNRSGRREAHLPCTPDPTHPRGGRISTSRTPTPGAFRLQEHHEKKVTWFSSHNGRSQTLIFLDLNRGCKGGGMSLEFVECDHFACDGVAFQPAVCDNADDLGLEGYWIEIQMNDR